MSSDTPTSCSKKRHYCCICSNYGGKVINNKIMSLHRFPSDKTLKNAWLSRIRAVSPYFKLNQTNDRLCSAHFKDGMYQKNSAEHQIPCFFVLADGSVKKFEAEPVGQNLWNSQENPEAMDISDSEPQFESTSMSVTLTQPREMANECLSLFIHNYHSSPYYIEREIRSKLPKSVQTISVHPSVSHKETSTKDIDISLEKSNQNLVSRSTQTDVAGECCHKATVFKTEIKTQSVGIQVVKPDLTFEDISESDEMCMFYTGIPNAGTFNLLFNEMLDAEQHTHRTGSGENKGRPRTLRLIDEFFLVLMRLRLGLLLQDLAQRFHVSKSTCSNITNTWISYLSVKLAFLTPWPSRSVIQRTLPNKFKRKYPDCRVIIDCTEIYTETPQSLINKSLMFSHYKSHMTYKALLGISPTGIITFSSDLWAGSISDKQLTKNCGLLDLCESGDAIMADKGFLISDLTTPRGIRLIIPPFKHRRFSRQQVEETRRIANYRIDVERAMERVKNFRILQGVMPINISHQATKIWKLCVCLSNLLPPLIQDNEE